MITLAALMRLDYGGAMLETETSSETVAGVQVRVMIAGVRETAVKVVRIT